MDDNTYIHPSGCKTTANSTPVAADAVADWRKDPKFNILFVLVLGVASIVVATLTANFFLDFNIAKTIIYRLVLASIAIIFVVRWYQGKQDLEVLVTLSKAQLAILLVSLPLIAGVFGYGWLHCLSWKNETFQKNESVKVERDRRQGMEAELIRDFKISGREFKKGEVLPLVLTNNSVQEEQRGPYKFIKVYTNEKETAWISLENAALMPKTLHYEGYDKRESLDGKTWTIIFNTDQLVKVVDNFPIGQKYIVTGAPAGKLKAPHVNDFNKFMDVPMGGIDENQTASNLYYKSEPGTKITIRFL